MATLFSLSAYVVAEDATNPLIPLNPISQLTSGELDIPYAAHAFTNDWETGILSSNNSMHSCYNDNYYSNSVGNASNNASTVNSFSASSDNDTICSDVVSNDTGITTSDKLISNNDVYTGFDNGTAYDAVPSNGSIRKNDVTCGDEDATIDDTNVTTSDDTTTSNDTATSDDTNTIDDANVTNGDETNTTATTNVGDNNNVTSCDNNSAILNDSTAKSDVAINPSNSSSSVTINFTIEETIDEFLDDNISERFTATTLIEPATDDDKTPLTAPSSSPSTEPENCNVNFSFDESLFIFDWDDTLMPSTWIQLQNIPFQGLHPMDVNNTILLEMTEFSRKTLEAATKLGTVIIITNADSGWVELSCDRFMPKLQPYLKNIRIVSARSTYSCDDSSSPYAWKYCAFRDEIEKHFKSRPSSRRNIISLGDSSHERIALLKLRDKFQDCESRLKSVKFIERPQIEELKQEHELLCCSLQLVMQTDENLDLCIQISGNSIRNCEPEIDSLDIADNTPQLIEEDVYLTL